MNSIRLFKNVKVISRIYYPRYYASFSGIKKNFQCYLNSSPRTNSTSHFKPSLESFKYFSNCNSMQTKDSDLTSEKNGDQKIQRVLEDEEFQNILKDFANDFGVDNETNELLDDIRKNIDEDYKNNNMSEEKHNTNNENDASPILGGGLDHRYKEFSDTDSTVIHSYEENYLAEDEKFYHVDQEMKPKLPYSDLKRGITGVFDIDQMIEVLRNESLLDITAISIPEELHYADFLVLVTAKSERHSDAVAESIKKLYKQKKNKKDFFVKIEGEDVSDWKVMDMGNIVLHIFLEETRALYDLESLWLLDSKFDSGGTSQSDPMLNIIEEQLEFFNSLQKSNSPESPKDSS